MILRYLSKMHLTKTKFIFISIFVLSFLGFLDTTYLTILHYKNIIPPCTITSGCEMVLTSKYAIILGVPIALIGSLFYFVIIVLSTLLITNYKKIYLNILNLFVFLGIIVSVMLFLIQTFMLRSFCQYCFASEIISFLIFGLSMLFIFKVRAPPF